MDQYLIGVWPHGLTQEIAALLQPAADRGRCGIEQGNGWTLWTVHRGHDLIAAANVRRTDDAAAEVVLVGGTEFRGWIGQLDSLIGRWAKDEGATVLRAYGRRGWIPTLTKQGWVARINDMGVTEFQRGLV